MILVSVTKNKNMLKIRKFANPKYKIVAAVFLLSVVSSVGTAIVAHADQYDAQINSLEQQNNSIQGNVDSLANQASSYQAEISQLQNQVDSMQAALSVNEAKQASDEQQIASDQQNIATNKQYLRDDLRTMYVDGQLSTIEELATSKNLSDFVNKEEYRTAVQGKVTSLIQQIAALQTQLQAQKAQVDVLVNTEKQQEDQLASSQAQQQQLLSYNQAQQSQYNSQIQSNQSQIATLRQEQIQANRRLVSSGGGTVDASGTCGGSYPASATNNYGGHWGCDYPLDNALDNWGMYNRECVSYTAWMVYKTYGYMPYWGGSGDANEWPGDAEAAGIPVGSTPKVGSVAIYMGGSGDPWGHAMWVDSVNGSMITVSQYNLYYDGNYYQTTISSAGLVYIYFGG
ncbi:MAG TPA: CHAP domain-containing protein [Candidatus Sulfotelmatobacter sp.]|nr:CHAP domain-containing protein [Candidatus Sulfotelmatobacter sp.]